MVWVYKNYFILHAADKSNSFTSFTTEKEYRAARYSKISKKRYYSVIIVLSFLIHMYMQF